ncbi:cysteine protease required for autophagy [Russula earlei]|uniref:Cysteine protease required for autophagy n=1 Tax=Russula earlei TaxID=71964 RepID=A0ACC0U3F5_9AGAM|nr:cysteine protease required for autophagy [Russula earlei]
MSSKSRHSSSASTPANSSKLPKFLQSKQTRDRSRSMIDPASGSSSTASSSSQSSNVLLDPPPSPSITQIPKRSIIRRGSKLFGVKESSSLPHDADVSEDFGAADDSTDEPPIIIEPAPSRVRMRPERPLSSVSDNHLSYYQSSHSTTRLSDIPTRLSGWFQHAFNSSSTDLTLPHLINSGHLPPTSASPKGKSSALLTAAKHGKGHLDKAMRYLLDSDSTPDKCTDPIWLLGVQHTGYEPPAEAPSPVLSRRGSVDSRRASSFRTSTSSTVTASPGGGNTLSSSQISSSKHPPAHWPPAFYGDFTSRVWITYRSHFCPLRDSSLSMLEREQAEAAATGSLIPISSSPPTKRWWPGGEKGWTSDAGWGCMLRTGQSMLATALIHLHLGRDWRRPPHPVYTADYATYVQILTWFFDSPSPLCPFSVHRMALAGKELGKDVGQWFGPSTAAGAIKTLVHNFPEASLGISVAVDSQIFQTDVYSASHPPTGSPRPHKGSRWGGRAVVVLIGIRLGLDGVNPIYYDTIKALYTFPQSIGIAGGRPSSSYYFVGSQADNLFYLDPHHSRTTIPLRLPPHVAERVRGIPIKQGMPERGSVSPPGHHRSPTSPASSRTGSSSFSYRAPASPSPLSKQLSTSSSSSGGAHARWHSTGANGAGSELSGATSDTGLDVTQMHYATAYSPAELRTFHCERVRKMPLSGLDPSMLIGFLCKDEADWVDLRERVTELFKNHKTIFSIVDEPPSWSDVDDSLESMSEPDEEEDMPEDKDSSRSIAGDEGVQGEEDSDDSDGDFFDAGEDVAVEDRVSSRAASKGGQNEVDTENDPIGPMTPGPSVSTATETTAVPRKTHAVSFRHTSSADEVDPDDEEWVDPTPIPATPLEPTPPLFTDGPAVPPMMAKAKSSSSTKSRKRKETRMTVPFPSCQAEGTDDRPRRVPQMSTARARDGGRTQSGGVKGVIAPAPESGPEVEPASQLDDPDGDDF